MNASIKRVGIILKRQDARVSSVVSDIISWLQARNMEVFVDQNAIEECPSGTRPVPAQELARQVDLVSVFGGDGTLLYAARLVGASGVPILGINLGSLGFLAEVKLSDVYKAFECIFRGQYQVEERMLLDVGALRNGQPIGRYLALNDAVINKGALARIIELEVRVNGEPVLLTRADGLIVSTPTGSTAYSLAAGGPILYPTLEAFIIAPICPHTLTNRPVVIPDRDVLEVCLWRGTDVMLTIDGQVGMPLQQHDCVRVHRAGSTLRLVMPFGNSFFRLLREKLRWG